MSNIKLITEDTDLNSIKVIKMEWDVELNNRKYQVVKIPGYIHRIGGYHGENDFWMYPRDEQPNYKNLIEYDADGCGVCWGIKYEPQNYYKEKWGEVECRTSKSVKITRNGKDFYFCWSIDEARYFIERIQTHPIEFNRYGFEESLIGRKVWWRSEPAIVEEWIEGQACVILKPDGFDKFAIPAEFVNENVYQESEDYIKADIFDKHIWWFRD